MDMLGHISLYVEALIKGPLNKGHSLYTATSFTFRVFVNRVLGAQAQCRKTGLTGSTGLRATAEAGAESENEIDRIEGRR